MNTIRGNILDIENGIICHQVNCKGVANDGLAKQIRNKWPEWYTDYLINHSYNNDILGTISYYVVSHTPYIEVVNLYAQLYYGRTKQHTDYKAFRQCLEKVNNACRSHQIYLPYGIGCGLGGGSWNIISKIIDEILPNAIIVKL